MDIKLKKRIIGFLLLIGFGLILIPLFFGHSIPEDELKISAHVPEPPATPHDLTAPMPDRVVTVPDMATAAQPAATPAASQSASAVTFEQVQSRPPLPAADNASPKPVATTPAVTDTAKKPVAAVATSVSAPAPTASATTLTTATTNTSQTSVATPSLSASSTTKTATTTTTKKTTKTAVPQKTTTAASKSTTPSKAKATAKTEQKIPNVKGWAVQLGSFSDKANANSLVSKLQSQGFKAYTKTTKTAKGVLIRVLVGPELKQANAQATVTKLKKQLNLSSIIVPMES